MRSLLVGLAFLAATNASAYSHSFVNRAGAPVRFWVNYIGCSNDTWTVKPGQTITWRSGLCCIKNVNAGEVAGGGGKSVRTDRPDIPMRTGSVDTAIFDIITSPWSLAEAAQCHNTNWALNVLSGHKATIVKL